MHSASYKHKFSLFLILSRHAVHLFDYRSRALTSRAAALPVTLIDTPQTTFLRQSV